MIKNIIFDWSGVICDNSRNVFEVSMKVFERFGAKRISFEEFRREWEQPYMIFFNKYIPDTTKEQNDRIYVEEIIKLPRPEAFPGIKEVLKQLKESGRNLILLSSDSPVTLRQELKKFNLENIFVEIFDDIHDKTEVIDGIMEKYNFKPAETIFIGDTTHEIETGKKVNIKTGAVTWGLQYEDKLRSAKPDYLFHQVNDIIDILK